MQVDIICVSRNGDAVEDETTEDSYYVGNVINDVRHDMIGQCPNPYNSALDVVDSTGV